MTLFRSKRFILALFAVLLAALVHGWEQFEFQLEQGVHNTADDASYLRPVENYLENGVWKDNSIGASSFVQRPPLMGWIHGVLFLITKKKSAFSFYLLALLLHGCAVYQLPQLLEKINRAKNNYLFTFLYALLPCFWGFLSYQITEALTGSFIVFILAICVSKHPLKVGLLILSLSLVLLFRPLLILLLPVVVYSIWKEREVLNTRFNWKQFALIATGLFLFIAWEVRKAEKMDQWGVLHPIYHSSNETVFRPAHAELTNLFRVWETRPEQFHTIVGQCWSTNPNSIDTQNLKSIISERNVPLKFNELYSVLKAYKAVNLNAMEQFDQDKKLKETPQEIVFRNRIRLLTNRLIKEHPFQYYISTPLLGISEQLSKSQLNLGIFQLTFRGSWWVEIVRWICLLVLTFGYILVPFFLFFGNTIQKWLCLGVVFYLIYLFWFQRMNEDRYFIPFLPMLFILIANSIPTIYRTMMNSVRRFF